MLKKVKEHLVVNDSMDFSVSVFFDEAAKVREYLENYTKLDLSWISEHKEGYQFTLEKLDGKKYNCIWVNPNSKSLLRTIVHECGHSVHAIFRDKGIIFSSDSEECFMYTIDWMVDQLFKRFKLSIQTSKQDE